MELDINGEIYNFKFGIKFLKDINETQKMKDRDSGEMKAVGFAYKAAGIMDGNILDLVEVLSVANRTEEKRISKDEIEEYLDDDNTNIDNVFQQTIDFLSESNACKNQMRSIMKNLEKAFESIPDSDEKMIMYRPKI